MFLEKRKNYDYSIDWTMRLPDFYILQKPKRHSTDIDNFRQKEKLTNDI
jgi:hypothetical protein